MRGVWLALERAARQDRDGLGWRSFHRQPKFFLIGDAIVLYALLDDFVPNESLKSDQGSLHDGLQ
jgi:hypothetical protein